MAVLSVLMRKNIFGSRLRIDWQDIVWSGKN